MSTLKDKQYTNSSNYNARILLHQKFSTNKYSWPLWLFDRIDKIEDAKVLEIGCGNGILWKLNADRIPETWNITLTDFSEGMLRDAEENTGNLSACINYEIMDAVNISKEDNSFDIILANHMLYHIPDKRQALSEIRRVLKKHGLFYTTTMDGEYMKELSCIIREYRSIPGGAGKSNSVIQNFSLQNGREQLLAYFNDVNLEIYKNSLKITEAAPLTDYVVSLNNIISGRVLLQESEIDSFTSFIQNRINKEGSIVVSADAGIFISINNHN